MRRYVAAGGPDETSCEADCLGVHGVFVKDLWGLELLLPLNSLTPVFTCSFFFGLYSNLESKAHLALANFSDFTSSRL